MRNKNAILVFAITLALVSLYQLSFTYVTNKVRKDAKEYAQGNLEKEMSYLDSIAGLPKSQWSYLGNTFRECQEKEINLGLDLKGGMNVILEISVVDIVRSLSNYSTDTTFVKALSLAKERQRNSQEDFLTLFQQAFEETDPNASLAAIFNTMELRDRVSFNSTNDEVMRVLRNETRDAIDNAFNILTTRIDRFGVVQPNISRLETQGRILVELPGIKEPDRVRKLLQGSARLEFWETYENEELYPYFLEANAKLKEILDAEKALSSDEETAEATEIPSLQETPGGEAAVEEADTGALSLLEQLEAEQEDLDSAAISQELMENYPLFAVLNPNTAGDGRTLLPGSEVGYAHWNDTAQVMRYLNMPQIRSIFPRDVRFYWDVNPIRGDETESWYYLHAIRVTSRDGQPPLDGDVITQARAEFSQNQGNAEVSMNMNAEGAREWARLTGNNVGRRIAIVLDNLVYSSAVVQGEIKGGATSITGNFTLDEARDLANILKSGKLPAPARIIQEAIVGPSLGRDAIRAGVNSFLIAFVLVLFYMVFYYSHRAGLVADIALITNMFFLMGVLASLGPVLTLPGIAGIVLTIGISVDSNVLIFERIREELRAGKGMRLAIADGYKNAYSAIIDANVTSLLTGIILYVFGTGPIKGFATTLVLGILTSLFSAIFITRLVFERSLDRNTKLSFATRISEKILQNPKVDFLGKRKVTYVLSGAILMVSIVSLSVRGLNAGVDFTGGRNFVVRFYEPVNTTEVQASLADVLNDPPQVIIYGSTDMVRISTQFMIDSVGDDIDRHVEEQLFAGLKPFYPEDFTLEEFTAQSAEKEVGLMSSQMVGPTIADDIKVQAVWAILFSLIAIFLYILIRFRNWQYGLGAVVSLVHDSIIVLGLFSLLYGRMPFSLEIDQAFIAAILTVVGYSINDTVIIYDRIREYVGLYRKRERGEIINAALNSTLTRTMNTSLTTFVVLLSIFLLGGEVIRGFIFALLIGILVGTYSSWFVATPILYDTVGRARLRAKARE
ncbi:MAG TPA: protein translocase subunit SecDF [Bacteroidetes bacterium]|nr:protein translocase subunit SecDF [Bacteroidota bacterium]